jgi:hypothetical protein
MTDRIRKRIASVTLAVFAGLLFVAQSPAAAPDKTERSLLTPSPSSRTTPKQTPSQSPKKAPKQAPRQAPKQPANQAQRPAPRTASNAAPPAAGKKYDLRYRLRAGEILRYDVEHEAAIRSTIDESTQAAQTQTSSVKAWKVIDVLPNGQMEFANVVESVKMVNQLPDRAATEYDSRRDKTPPPGFEQAAKAVGVPLSLIRITPRGEIVRRNIKVKQEAAEDDAAIVVRLPDKPVAVGDTWDEEHKLMVEVQDGSKPLESRRHFKLTNVANGIATIEVTYQVLSPVTPQIESQIVARLMKGTVRFDIRRGRVVGQQMEVDKRILGFAGPTSSLHYVMRMQEELAGPAKVARKSR